MNKSDLINEIAGSTGLTKTKSNEVLNSIVNTIKSNLVKGEKVTLVGFGTFNTIDRKSRRGRNPKTGKEIQIPAKKVARFKAGSGLTDSIN